MQLLLIGSGGREHALAQAMAASPLCSQLYVAPGNGGTSGLEKTENVAIKATAIDELVDFALQHHIDLTVVGPDDPLALGIVDRFQAAGLRIFGPTAAAAQIESSKAFAKELMQTSGIPTASFSIFEDYRLALAYLRRRQLPVVVKASGLALGKGAYICTTTEEAEQALTAIMVDRAHGDAGREVVIETYLEGPEISVHAVCDGENFILFPSVQDHKPVGPGNQGKMTGGMGTIAPVPGVSEELMDQIADQIVSPVLKALAARGQRFTGCLFPGIKLTPDGPKVLEFNARWGDPETQCLMRLLKTDIVVLFNACVDHKLDQIDVEWHPGSAACIILASGGYPDDYAKGFPIIGLDRAEEVRDVIVYQAGTARKDGQLVTNGGRVLGVSATGQTLDEALNRAYEGVMAVDFAHLYYRTDIGAEALER